MIKKYVSKFRILVVAGVAALLIALVTGLGGQLAEARPYHSKRDLARIHEFFQSQPYDTNTYFATGGRCGGCHGHDPTHISLYTSWGEDVNIMDDWQGTMMANSAKDPLWRAKVSHETAVNPGLQLETEDKCTTCHAPTGHFEAHYLGQQYYTMNMLATDSFGLDGVNCTGCHEIKDTLQGNNFTGNLFYAQKQVFGPVQDPVSAVMEFFVGFTPSYSAHMTHSELCAGCHTLITNTTDLSGNLTGGTYIEQATYHEWKNSSYPANGITCQHCHIPQIQDSVKLATNYPFIEGRFPFDRHHLIGGNAFMLKLMQGNMSTVGNTCESWNFDTTINRTTRYLRDSTLNMQVVQTARTVDTVFYDVQLTNKCGHKFPSGYPARIAWVEFVVTDNLGDTLFADGLHDAAGNVIGRDPGFEPHHDVINNVNDVQIYEMVMGDVNNNPTTVLERADTCLKDNRIVPVGFSTSHPSYDSTRVIGVTNDPDFNYNGPVEGTGGDIVHFHVFLNGYAGALNVTSRVYYSSVPAKWLTEMFSYNTAPINSFHTMYDNADHTPMLVAEQIMTNTITGTSSQNGLPGITCYPNPVTDGTVHFSGYAGSGLQEVRVYDLSGKEVLPAIPGNEFDGTLVLPGRGVYLVSFRTARGTVVKKIISH
ncbi:MAG TPA: T9SS type A sorting domain-containing protein [Bacteroidia bacterium]|nr:T9SS type A sorting domain-containing protein [Bacteroidia bacterium]